MNRRLSKRINKKTVEIFIEWLKTVVDESEHEKIDPKKYKEYIPDHAYYWSGNTLINSIFTPRWIKKKLKYMHRNSPRAIEDYCLSDFK